MMQKIIKQKNKHTFIKLGFKSMFMAYTQKVVVSSNYSTKSLSAKFST